MYKFSLASVNDKYIPLNTNLANKLTVKYAHRPPPWPPHPPALAPHPPHLPTPPPVDYCLSFVPNCWKLVLYCLALTQHCLGVVPCNLTVAHLHPLRAPSWKMTDRRETATERLRCTRSVNQTFIKIVRKIVYGAVLIHEELRKTCWILHEPALVPCPGYSEPIEDLIGCSTPWCHSQTFSRNSYPTYHPRSSM